MGQITVADVREKFVKMARPEFERGDLCLKGIGGGGILRPRDFMSGILPCARTGTREEEAGAGFAEKVLRLHGGREQARGGRGEKKQGRIIDLSRARQARKRIGRKKKSSRQHGAWREIVSTIIAKTVRKKIRTLEIAAGVARGRHWDPFILVSGAELTSKDDRKRESVRSETPGQKVQKSFKRGVARKPRTEPDEVGREMHAFVGDQKRPGKMMVDRLIDKGLRGVRDFSFLSRAPTCRRELRLEGKRTGGEPPSMSLFRRCKKSLYEYLVRGS